MADVDTGDILRIGCGLVFEGIYDVVNVYHMRADLEAGVTWTTMSNTMQAYVNNLYDTLKAPLSDEIGTGVISLANVTQDTTVGAIAWSPTWGGADTSEVLPPGVCCFAWARTYTPRVQIRKYFGVFGEGNLTVGFWSSAVQTACEAVLTYHIAPHDLGSGITLTGVAYNRTLSTSAEAVSVDSSAEPSYQRRRKRGRGS